MAVPEMYLNHHLCFTSSWLPIPLPSHSKANSAHSCWFSLSVKSPIVLIRTRNLRKSLLHGGQWRSAPEQTREHPRWFAKYFSFRQTCFPLILNSLCIFKGNVIHMFLVEQLLRKEVGKEHGRIPTPAIREMAAAQGGDYVCALTECTLDQEEERTVLSRLSSPPVTHSLTLPPHVYWALANPTSY